MNIRGGYTYLDATFQSEEEVAGAGNSSNEEAQEIPGLEGNIEIEPGNRIPLIPQHMLKAYADVQITSKFVVDLGLFSASDSYARGNENNQHEPDGTYYLGPGKSDSYAVVNLGARYQVHPRIQLYVQVNNLFDSQYYTAAQLAATGFTSTGSFIARPFPPVEGEDPLVNATFFAPGGAERRLGWDSAAVLRQHSI